MNNRCFGLTRNLNFCQRKGNWRLFCQEHRKQPIVWITFLVFTIIAGTSSILSYCSKNQVKNQNSYTLTNEQKIIFTEILKKPRKSKESIKLGCAYNDVNACVFSGQLFNLFRESGWKVEGNKVEPTTLNVPLSGIVIFNYGAGKPDFSDPKSGLWVPVTDSLIIVQSSFASIGLSVEYRADPKFPKNVIGIYIGPFPYK